MAKFEDSIEIENEFDSIEEVDELQEPEEQENQEELVVAENPEDNLPDKYRGKTLTEIAKMHQEAERLIGRQAQEVGEVRRLADELLKRGLSQDKAVETPKEQDYATRLYEDPATVINETVERHPAIAEARQQAQAMKQQQVTQRLNEQFSNFSEITSDPKFFEWVKASPIRTRLFTEAHSQFDYNSAVELLSTWNIINSNKSQGNSQLVVESKKGTKESLRAAAVDTGSSASTSRKIYPRRDLIELRMRDPDRYDSMGDLILAAYAEGRVR